MRRKSLLNFKQAASGNEQAVFANMYLMFTFRRGIPQNILSIISCKYNLSFSGNICFMEHHIAIAIGMTIQATKKCHPRKDDTLYGKEKIVYFMIPCSTNTFFSICTPRSTCSSVCVAIKAKRTNVS